jgi:serine protease
MTQGNIGSVFVLVLDSDTFEIVEVTETDATQQYAYTMPSLAPGTYVIQAGTDRDQNGIVCEIEDACGLFPDVVVVTAGQDTSGVDFLVGDVVSPQNRLVTTDTP